MGSREQSLPARTGPPAARPAVLSRLLHPACHRSTPASPRSAPTALRAGSKIRLRSRIAFRYQLKSSPPPSASTPLAACAVSALSPSVPNDCGRSPRPSWPDSGIARHSASPTGSAGNTHTAPPAADPIRTCAHCPSRFRTSFTFCLARPNSGDFWQSRRFWHSPRARVTSIPKDLELSIPHSPQELTLVPRSFLRRLPPFSISAVRN